jgi:hypothetical protein
MEHGVNHLPTFRAQVYMSRSFSSTLTYLTYSCTHLNDVVKGDNNSTINYYKKIYVYLIHAVA